MKKVFSVLVIAVAAVASQAVTFTNFVYSGGQLGSGITSTVFGTGVTFTTPNAKVGDTVIVSGNPYRSGNFSIQYDAESTASMTADNVSINLGGGLSGSGTIAFKEQIFKLDSLGNEVAFLGEVEHVFTGGGPINWSNVISWSDTSVTRIRAKKTFEMFAPDTAALDFAVVGFVNQSLQVVPEPGPFIAMGLGLVGLVARRRRSK
ncbi:MAG: PEP-CTERM sorting domain-containing protein [Armatimonadetes bacterium]|nr:PEP-CTERM sorting domain-containing protein [Armatimonadota bacterium]